MTAQDQEGAPTPTPTEPVLEGVGEPAEERTVVDTPPPVDPELIERMQHVREEIAQDERALDDLSDPKP